jgi:radical SAM superfamily enzyme YgiQ (UPF0313 family)
VGGPGNGFTCRGPGASEADETIRVQGAFDRLRIGTERNLDGEGISVLGTFVFGFDHENKDVFDQTIEFCMKCCIDGAQVRILTPFPGTRLYTRLLKERRLLAPNWWLHGCSSRTLLFQLKGMTEDELADGIACLQRHVYSFASIIKRLFGMSLRKRGKVGTQLYTSFNLAMRKRYFSELGELQSFKAPRT